MEGKVVGSRKSGKDGGVAKRGGRWVEGKKEAGHCEENYTDSRAAEEGG
jgi:hypothetical protein